MTQSPRVAMVVPTVRESSILRFLHEWAPFPWDDTIVVEDQPTATFEPIHGISLFSWRDIAVDLKDNNWIISRRSSAIRSYGLWKAWQRGADIVATLDDDCYPTSTIARDRFVSDHLANLQESPRWITTVPGLRVRGLPYRNSGLHRQVVANLGLWENCPDIDAIQSLAACSSLTAEIPAGSRVMPSGQYFPFCGMNFAVLREWVPALYFAPSGANSPYDRFDDIWCGVILQRICHHLRMAISCGQPIVRHDRASDPFVNLQKESQGLGANERFWEIIDNIPLTEQHTNVLSCLTEIAWGMRGLPNGSPCDSKLAAYLRHYGAAILVWVNQFEETAPVA